MHLYVIEHRYCLNFAISGIHTDGGNVEVAQIILQEHFILLYLYFYYIPFFCAL